MQLTPVASTNLHAVGYSAATNQLWIQFKNGTVYQYDGVPAQTYNDMMTGDSGRYFAEIIKPQRYTMPFTKLGVLPLAVGPASVFDDSPVEDM